MLATVATPTQRLTPVSPLGLALAGPAEIEAKAGAGETGRFTGKVLRRGGYAQPVKVTLEGLPQGYPAPEVVLAAEATEFALPVNFPYGAKEGKLQGVKLVAVSQPDPQNAATLRSEAIAVALNVVPGEKPPAERLNPHSSRAAGATSAQMSPQRRFTMSSRVAVRSAAAGVGYGIQFSSAS